MSEKISLDSSETRVIILAIQIATFCWSVYSVQLSAISRLGHIFSESETIFELSLQFSPQKKR